MDNYSSFNILEIGEQYSMGENGFLYYNNIRNKNVYNRIILSSILNLHKKNYVEIEKNEKNELIIKIKLNTSPLKKNLNRLYNCLKRLDKNKTTKSFTIP